MGSCFCGHFTVHRQLSSEMVGQAIVGQALIMTYYCFLCNKDHDDTPTEEHFIPKSIDVPKGQWLPVCNFSNVRSNSVFDSGVKDILYMARFRNIKILKRTGDALLGNGTLKKYKFSYDEPAALKGKDIFQYIFDRETNKRIPSKGVSAIKFSVGLDQKEQEMFCRGLAKMSIGALAYLLIRDGVQSNKIKQLFSQKSIDFLRNFALNLPWLFGSPISQVISLGRTDVLLELQSFCKAPLLSNHVIEINLQKKNLIHIEGMLYSQYGWQLNLENTVPIDLDVLRLENPISDMPAPVNLVDKTLSPDSIVIINSDYRGKKPDVPRDWRNNHDD
jgi:hypothetical protein